MIKKPIPQSADPSVGANFFRGVDRVPKKKPLNCAVIGGTVLRQPDPPLDPSTNGEPHDLLFY